jgi:hypothetical protein
MLVICLVEEDVLPVSSLQQQQQQQHGARHDRLAVNKAPAALLA